LDGAFIVDNDGVVEKVGTYLNPPGSKNVQMIGGFGAKA
jgi:hypothetical protein